jgi:hypothetical protein
VLGADWLFTTNTLVRVTLPVLVTVPVNTKVPPGATGSAGQSVATTMPELVPVPIGQVELAVFETGAPQRLVA